MEQSIENIQQLLATELHDLEIILETNAQSKSKLANSVIKHLLSGNSKRLRPIITILSALAHNHPSDNTDHIELAAIIEFLHTASLLHDDVIDHADKRRGHPTAHTIWGNTASILSGDFLHAKAFQMTTDLNNYSIQRHLADATECVIEGELNHLDKNRDIKLSKVEYLQIISAKTAKLFSLSSQLGTLIATDDHDACTHMAEYGHHLGIVFQIVDDCLDYQKPDKKLGKNTGQDLQEGKPTLPIILAYQHASPEDKHAIEEQFLNAHSTVADLQPYLHKTDALNKSMQEAHTAAELARGALQHLQPSAYKSALEQLITFALQRVF